MIDFKNRLSELKSRRQGAHERAIFENVGFESYSTDAQEVEKYEQLSVNDAVKYVIGAMAPVSSKSTQISIAEGERVASTLIEMLKTAGIKAEMELQGSVALDIHIEGHSDVDMLILHGDIVLVQTPKLNGSAVYCADQRSMEDIIRELRLVSEEKLTSRYYSASVDISGSKSIALSDGSLQRKVDVVPSCWYNTHDYQRSGQKHDRGIKIYDKSKHELYGNFPFLHKKRVDDKDMLYSGNLKKVIRLMKNVVADMPEAKRKKAKALSSYDLAGIGYCMDKQLECPTFMPLALIERLRSHLLNLYIDAEQRKRLEVPDGTRKVFDQDEKVDALLILYSEINDLALAIYKALKPQFGDKYDGRVLSEQQVQYF